MAEKSERERLVLPEAVMGTSLYTVEAPRTMRADGYPWAHEIRVTLPLSYAEEAGKRYPVLWVTDNWLEIALAAIWHAELIIVSIGDDRASGGAYSGRRAYDFYPAEDIYPPGLCGDALRIRDDGRYKGGGAKQFLDFLIDDVRPALEAEYRMDPDDHGLEGASAGGWFVLYALLTRPGSFSKYIAVAPALCFCDNVIFDLEEGYASEHDDLPGELFMGCGDGEMTHDAVLGCFSSMAKMVEMLSFPNYPSLRMLAMVFPGETHATALPPGIGWGVRSLWGEAIAPAPFG